MNNLILMNMINKRIEHLLSEGLTEDSVADIINWEFDKEYSGEDIIKIYEGGEI